MTDATPTPPVPDPATPSTPAAAAPPPPPPAASPYGTPQPYAQPQYAVGPRTNVLAIISLVASLLGVFVWIIAPIAGIVMGHIALSQIKRTGEAGRGLAMAGTVIGYVLAGLGIIFIVIYFIVIAIAVSTAGTYSNFVN